MDASSRLLLQPASGISDGSKPKPSLAKGDTSDLATYLEKESRGVFDRFNDRIWGIDESILAPNFTAQMDNASAPMSWERLVRTQAAAVAEDPSYVVNILEASVFIDDAAGYASVIMLVEIVGRPTTIEREDAFVEEWKKIRGKWQWSRHTSMRGSSGIRLADTFAHRQP